MHACMRVFVRACVRACEGPHAHGLAELADGGGRVEYDLGPVQGEPQPVERVVAPLQPGQPPIAAVPQKLHEALRRCAPLSINCVHALWDLRTRTRLQERGSAGNHSFSAAFSDGTGVMGAAWGCGMCSGQRQAYIADVNADATKRGFEDGVPRVALHIVRGLIEVPDPGDVVLRRPPPLP